MLTFPECTLPSPTGMNPRERTPKSARQVPKVAACRRSRKDAHMAWFVIQLRCLLPWLKLSCQMVQMAINDLYGAVSPRLGSTQSQLSHLAPGTRCIEISLFVGHACFACHLSRRLETSSNSAMKAAGELRTSYHFFVLVHFELRLVCYNTSEVFVWSWSENCSWLCLATALHFPRVADRQVRIC